MAQPLERLSTAVPVRKIIKNYTTLSSFIGVILRGSVIYNETILMIVRKHHKQSDYIKTSIYLLSY